MKELSSVNIQPFTVGIIVILLICFSVAQEVSDWKKFSFSEEPKDVVVRKGSSVWLHCAVRGNLNPSITWRKDDSPLNLVFGANRRLLRNGTLFIRTATNRRSDSDSGTYQCVASAPSLGTIISTVATLTIAAGGWEKGLPKFSEQPSDMAVYEGDRARFPCSIESLPPARIVWHRDGHKLRLDSRMSLLPSGALEIENVDLSDIGEYYCHAVSFDKTKVSSKAILQVQEALALREPAPPSFIARPTDFVGRIGQNVTLDCATNGYPAPSVIWLRDGTTIDMQDLDSRFIFFGPTRSLYINDLRESDEGMYTCRAENKIDSVNAIAHVQVDVSPKFLVKPLNTLSYENEDIELQCKIYGRPTPKVTWYKDGEQIHQSEYFKIMGPTNLKILGLVSGDSGMYQCFTSNSAGQLQASAQLLVVQAGFKPIKNLSEDDETLYQNSEKVKSINNFIESEQPSSPRHVNHIISSNRYITLSWHEPQYNSNDIVAYSVYYKQHGSNRERVQNVSASSSIDGVDVYKTQIGQLTPGSKYDIRVVAITSKGRMGESSNAIHVTTSPDLDLPEAPFGLKIIARSPNSLFVSWLPAPPTRTPVTEYILFFMEAGSANEHEIKTSSTSFDLINLEEYREYSVWVVAVNANGRGDPTHEVTERTFSDQPSGIPQNVTIEPASSKSLIISWEPPLPRDQNGIITGYKIKYKERRDSVSSTKTTDGNWRMLALTDLKKNTHYSIKISALTVNGSGPATHWIQARTFSSDLDENRVPDRPSSLRASPNRDSIDLFWRPPISQDVKIRGYTIGWGKGFPDVYQKVLRDDHQLTYVIASLEPNADYVISLRAFNNKGDGMPIYEQVRTSLKKKEAKTTLTPPVGVKTVVLTPFTIAVSWTDTTLSRNQYISDKGHYTVRYTTYAQASSSRPKYRYVNVSDVTVLIDNLKAATMYEFSVKAVKVRRVSPWSLVVMNTTLEARPSSPPRDITVVTMLDLPTKVVFNWQPPKQANGKITGYLIFYTTNPKNDWAMEEVTGSRMTCTLKGLTPSTLYFYKMQARNYKGFGPFSTMSNYTTLSGFSHSYSGPPGGAVQDKGAIFVIVGAAIGVIVFIAALGAFVVFCRRNKQPRHDNGTGTLTKLNKVEIKPPDLWIHHEQLELKNFEKNDRNTSPSHTTAISHAGHDFDDKNTTFTSTSTLDRRTPLHTTYIRDHLSDEETDKLLNRRSFKPKPLMVSLDINKDSMVGGSTSSSVYSDGTMGHPNYSTTHYPSAVQGYSPQENPYSTNNSCLMGPTLSAGCYTHDTPSNPTSHAFMGNITSPTGGGGNFNSLCSSDGGSSTLGKRCINPLRSFSVPAPPQSAPSTPQQKHIVAARPQGPTSPFKKALNLPPSGLISGIPTSARRVLPMSKVDSFPENEEANEGLLHGYSTEELTQEMANLEGLMKDLSAITANQFNC